MGDRWIIVNGWEKFQHRDALRSKQPVWIKNYVELLHRDDYLELTLSQRGLLHGLWLLYASSREQLRVSTALHFLGSQGYMQSQRRGVAGARAKAMQRDLEALNQAGFITLSASKPASEPASNPAGLEVEKKRERSSRTPSSAPARDTRRTDPSDDRYPHPCPACTTSCRSAIDLEAHIAQWHPELADTPPDDWAAIDAAAEGEGG